MTEKCLAIVKQSGEAAEPPTVYNLGPYQKGTTKTINELPPTGLKALEISTFFTVHNPS
jgi:hypothetical protein